MIIQSISPNTDIIIPDLQPDINKITLTELIDHIETENSLYYFDRLKRKNRRIKQQNSRKPKYILKKLITAVI